MPDTLIAGSRDSKLALVQTEQVIAALKAHWSDLDIALKTFKTQGDLILDTALSKIGDKGLFVKELEVALLNREIDFAVHSMKDMPSEQPEGLRLLPFGRRENPADALVSKNGLTFEDLPSGAIVGTSSLRRQALLKNRRPDLVYQTIRGNLQTRFRKLEEGPYEAIVLAAAGLHRLGLASKITEIFDPAIMVPACCQGILGIEVSSEHTAKYFTALEDPNTAIAAQAERAFLKTLEGGCQVPMGAYAQPLENGRFRLSGIIASLDGITVLKEHLDFESKNAKATGEALAKSLIHQGGQEILDAILSQNSAINHP